ncbi:MAG: hypothetical protein LBV51_03630 [Acholeplasmatales bacterium]|jgi:uncharacterized membrane protein YczE|nr:hypothetical protein [Acholeplasmatales bacterium]
MNKKATQIKITTSIYSILVFLLVIIYSSLKTPEIDTKVNLAFYLAIIISFIILVLATIFYAKFDKFISYLLYFIFYTVGMVVIGFGVSMIAIILTFAGFSP